MIYYNNKMYIMNVIIVYYSDNYVKMIRYWYNNNMVMIKDTIMLR